MARIARTTTHYIALSTEGALREYAVEERQGQVTRTIGRVTGRPGGTWTALGVGAPAWTAYFPTRAAAVESMRRGETFLDVAA